MQVTVPDGAMGGMQLQVQTPSGPMQTTIPDGLKAGDTFAIMIPGQPAAVPQPAQMIRGGPDGQRGSELAAKLVGDWEFEGSRMPCCFCPLLYQVPGTWTGRLTVNPLNAEGQYSILGSCDLWIPFFPFCAIPMPNMPALHCCPLAALTIVGTVDGNGQAGQIRFRNTNKAEWEPMGKWATVDKRLSRIDAGSASYASNGAGPLGYLKGTTEIDGQGTSITHKYEAGGLLGPGWTTIKATKIR